MATYWENSCSFGLRYVSWYKYLIVSLVFSHLGFWSGNLFLIAPFPDLCLLVPTSSTSEQSQNTISISSFESYQTSYTPTHYTASGSTKTMALTTTSNDQTPFMQFGKSPSSSQKDSVTSPTLEQSEKTIKPTTSEPTLSPTGMTTILKTASISNHAQSYVTGMTTAAMSHSVSDTNFDPCLGVSPDICNNGTETMSNFCECDNSGIWTIIQKRFDGSVDFYRNWTEYKEGFGDPSGELWLGNEAIHQITSSINYALKIYLTDWDNITKIAMYENFRIADEADGYRLTVNGFSGDAGDSLTLYHNGDMFSTKDKDNDRKKKEHLAVIFSSGWWFGSNFRSSLNGRYLFDPDSDNDGILWSGFGNGPRYSMKETKMLIRPIT